VRELVDVEEVRVDVVQDDGARDHAVRAPQASPLTNIVGADADGGD
jgi:hypothetical protein